MNRAIIKAVESDRAQKTFYPTPEPLAEKLLGGIKWNMVDCVLEPSAGKGDLALFVAKKMFYARHTMTAASGRQPRKPILTASRSTRFSAMPLKGADSGSFTMTSCHSRHKSVTR